MVPISGTADGLLLGWGSGFSSDTVPVKTLIPLVKLINRIIPLNVLLSHSAFHTLIARPHLRLPPNSF